MTWQEILLSLFVLLVVAVCIMYGIWYFNNCAFVPILEAPLACFPH